MAVATVAIFCVGILQYCTLKGQLDEMRVDQRPWVGLHGITPIRDDTAVTIEMINSGKSPAMNVKIKVLYHLENDGTIEIPKAPCTSDCDLDDIEMLPNVPITIRIPKNKEIHIPSNASIWLVARIDYKDIDKRPHKTMICYIRDAVTMKSCPSPNLNYAD